MECCLAFIVCRGQFVRRQKLEGFASQCGHSFFLCAARIQQAEPVSRCVWCHSSSQASNQSHITHTYRHEQSRRHGYTQPRPFRAATTKLSTSHPSSSSNGSSISTTISSSTPPQRHRHTSTTGRPADVAAAVLPRGCAAAA